MSITIGSVVISNNPSNESRWDYRKQSQMTTEYENGTFEVFTSGRTMIDVTLQIDYVSEEEWKELMIWLNSNQLYSAFPFDVIPPLHFDIGMGAGVRVNDVTYTGPSDTKELYTPVGRLGRKNVIFTFSYPKPIETALVDAEGAIVI